MVPTRTATVGASPRDCQPRDCQPRERQPRECQPRERQPLAGGQRGALASPRARRILVLTADAEADAPCAGRDPGAARPGGWPRIPAQPFRSAGHLGRRHPRPGHAEFRPSESGHPERGGTFPVATVPPDLERGRHRVGAPGSAATAIPAPGPAAIAAPAPGTPVPPAGPAAAARRPAQQARASRPGRRRLARPGSRLA